MVRIRLLRPALFVTLLFAGGVCLGILTHFADRSLFLSSASFEQFNRTNSLNSRLGNLLNTSREDSRGSLAVPQQQNERERQIQKGLAFGKGLSLLLDGISDPKSEDFHLIRSDILQGVPNYNTVILPPLKERALGSLLSRFSLKDWEAWPRSSVLNDSGPTAARDYVDSVMLQNRELGVFLETSALLLHGLYVTTSHGGVYDLSKGFDYLVNSADKLLGKNPVTPSSLPAKYLLSYTVPTDPSFLPTFERSRSDLVAQYSETHPDDLERNIRLLSSLDGRYHTPASSAQLSKALLRLAKDGTPRFRSQVVKMIIESGQLDQVFLSSQLVKRSAAHLVAIAAVDALEIKDVLKSRALLSQSLALANGLASQKLVIDFFREYGLGWVRPALDPVETAEILAEQPARRTDSHLQLSIFGVSVVLLAVVGALIGFLLVRRQGRVVVAPQSRPQSHKSLSIEPSLIRSPSVFLPEEARHQEFTLGETDIEEEEHSADTPSKKVVNYRLFDS